MKQRIGDIFGVLFLLLYAAIVFFFPWGFNALQGFHWTGIDFAGSFQDLTGLKNFGDTVNAAPYVSGFLKVAFLATFGEMLKNRRKTGSWKTPALLPKFIVWGLFGMLFTIVFAIFAKGVGSLCGTPIWFGPKMFNYSLAGWGDRIFVGFSISLWTNLIFCYPMMLAHEWFNTCITKKTFVGGADFIGGLDKHVWGSFMLKTILFFWIPAHTVTFSLPPDYRVLMSAVLSLALGFLLTVKPHGK